MLSVRFDPVTEVCVENKKKKKRALLTILVKTLMKVMPVFKAKLNFFYCGI